MRFIRQGFTLIELLIVMAILGVTMAIVVLSAGSVSATQVAMATKDTLRLMRYARNMALQTQQPVTLTFAPGTITIDTPFDQGDALPSTTTSSDTKSESKEEEDQNSKSKGSNLVAGDIEAVGLIKYYEDIAFEFIQFDDSIRMARSTTNDKADFNRRVVGEMDEEEGERLRQKTETFSITIRANGTTRPFTLRVYEKEAEDDTGNRVSFDFLCTGTIEDRTH